MIIKNTAKLATTPLRKDALSIVESAFASIITKKIIENNVKLHKGGLLLLKDHWIDLKKFRRIYLIGAGKGSFSSISVLENILQEYITDGIVLDIYGAPLKKVKSLVGDHPLPTETNVSATREIISLLSSASVDDLVLCVISGGGSALMCSPYKVSCEEKSKVTDALMKAGASIQEENTVRKHLSEIKGGQLAKLAHPAEIAALIFSDVPGDDLDMIASGPTVMDTTTIDDAAQILAKYDVLKVCKLPDCDLIETPKDPKYFRTVTNIIIANNRIPLKAMEEKAKQLKYKVEVFSSQIDGEAHEVAKMLVYNSKPKTALLAAGETRVKVEGDGSGGRNQHLVLSGLQFLKKGQVLVSVNSDGFDHTPHAGALGDSLTKEKAKNAAFPIKKYLENSDSFNFFEKIGDSIETGILGTNVADLMLVLSK